MVDTDESVGKRIEAARRRVGMAQRDLAEVAGLSQPTIQRIESGQRDVSSMELSLIADACGVLVADLLGTNTIPSDVLCAGRTDTEASALMSDYLVRALGLAQRMDELGIPEVA